MSIPVDYAERVYAGVLGKLIGVYIGRPFEGWSYERISAELGEIQYYVHERLGKPLIVTDDDIAGTFTFLRALPDHGNRRDLSPAEIGQTWLNYIIEKRSILWWGGLGNSTEHTAFLRLKHGVAAPESGSIALNGKVVAEQIGAQIFIDGWAMVAPGDPALAADLARRAASVSHDGEAIYGAQIIAAMEALAFVEPSLDRLIDEALTFIPNNSIIYRLIGDIREEHAKEPDWRRGREWLAANYGYDKYGGNCHMVPNHGLILLSLLYGDDDFQKSQMIVNTSGWDTDCNAGNVGCLLGIKNGLAGLETGPDWRGPVADRLYLSTADGGRAVTDAATEVYHVVNSGRALAGLAPLAPKEGARYHFELPGSVQGFLPEESVECTGTVAVENVAGHSSRGGRSLALRLQNVALGRSARVATATFIPPAAASMPGYGLSASPTLYPGQTVSLGIGADAANGQPIECCVFVKAYDADDKLTIVRGPSQTLIPGGYAEATWQIPPTGGQPIAEIGIEIASASRLAGTLYLDYLTWSGAPDVLLARPTAGGTMWRRAWVDGVDELGGGSETYRLIQNEGTGLLSQGTRDWRDYEAAVTLTPHLAKSAGLAVRVQGLRRYYALLLSGAGTGTENGAHGSAGRAKLVKQLEGTTTTLAEADFGWELGQTHELRLKVVGSRLVASVDDQIVLIADDAGEALDGGGVALVVEEGRVAADAVAVRPA